MLQKYDELELDDRLFALRQYLNVRGPTWEFDSAAELSSSIDAIKLDCERLKSMGHLTRISGNKVKLTLAGLDYMNREMEIRQEGAKQ